MLSKQIQNTKQTKRILKFFHETNNSHEMNSSDDNIQHTFDPLSLNMISTSRIGPNCFVKKIIKEKLIYCNQNILIQHDILNNISKDN